MKIGLFTNSSQTQIMRVDGDHPEVVIRNFGEDWSLPVGLNLKKNIYIYFLAVVTTLYLSKRPHLLQNTIV